MGSYVAFYLVGLYPVPATRQVLLSSPYFPEISFFNPTLNTTTTIKSTNFKGNPADGTGGTVFIKVCLLISYRVPLDRYFRTSERQSGRSTVEIELFLRLGCFHQGLYCGA